MKQSEVVDDADFGDPTLPGADWAIALVERRRGQRPRPRRAGRRRIRSKRGRAGLIVCYVLAGGTVAWLLVTGLMARGELSAAQRDLSTVRHQLAVGQVAQAESAARAVAHHLHEAHSLTTGPAWATVSAVPWFGAPARTTRTLTATADAIGRSAVPKLAAVASAIDPSTPVVTGHRIDVSSLIAQTPALDQAAAMLDGQLRRVQQLDTATWLPMVNSGAHRFTTALADLDTTADHAAQAAHAAPRMLGFDGPMRYFVGFQNEAESRGSGGLPGAFAILVADHGQLTFTHFGSDAEMVGVDSGLDLGTDFDAAWQNFDPAANYLNSTVSPDFSDAGRIWAAMWERKTGQHVDGAISLDPTALSYLLAVTGPAQLPDAQTVSAGNVVALTEQASYTRYATDNAARKQFVLDIAMAADQRLLAGGFDSTRMLHAVSHAIDDRRLLLWDADPAIETLLASSSVGGTVQPTAAPYAGAFVVNYASNKLDYYLRRSVTWTSSGCGSDRAVTVSVTLTNTAPPSGLPAYVTNRSDDPPYPVKPGDNKVMLYYLGTDGGYLSSADLGGSPVGVTAHTFDGHPSYSVIVELPRGTSRTVVLHLREPGRTAPQTVLQPGVGATALHVHAGGC